MGSVDSLLVNVEVRGMVMVAGMLSLEEDAKKRIEKRVKIGKSKEVEEAMTVKLQKRTPVKVVERVVYIDNDMRGLYVVILKSIVNFIWEFQSAEKQMEICIIKKLLKRLLLVK